MPLIISTILYPTPNNFTTTPILTGIRFKIRQIFISLTAIRFGFVILTKLVGTIKINFVHLILYVTRFMLACFLGSVRYDLGVSEDKWLSIKQLLTAIDGRLINIVGRPVWRCVGQLTVTEVSPNLTS